MLIRTVVCACIAGANGNAFVEAREATKEHAGEWTTQTPAVRKMTFADHALGCSCYTGGPVSSGSRV